MALGNLRPARPADRDALNALITRSARDLSRGWYTESETDGLIRYVFGVDTQLIADGTYYLVEQGGTIVACGGWSARQTLFGGDQAKGAEDGRLNPEVDAARIRAFFVDPSAARQGLGRRLLRHCESEARRAGFRTCELMATLPGEPFYRAEGYRALEPVSHPLPDGQQIRFVRMGRTIMPDTFANPDRDQVLRLAASAGLPTADLEAVNLAHFLACGDPLHPDGVVGLELHGVVALLRSLAVEEGSRGAGKGKALVAAAEAHARSRGVRELYLLTTTAEAFFRRLGYSPADRAGAPQAIRDTAEFSSLCPSSAAFLMKRLQTAGLPEPWLRGPVAGVPPLLQPAAHAFMLSLEDAERAAAGLSDADLWIRPGGAASAGYHLLHLSGSTDRLLTYARGAALSPEQLAALAAEKDTHPARTLADLMEAWRETVRRALEQLAETPQGVLDETRAVGRAGLPATVLGLLFHAAEHSQRHAGQLATTVKVLHGMSGNPHDS